jgi:tetratricopeptide (TPR) repeat protein
MKPVRPFKRGVARVRHLWLAKKYEDALAEVSRLLKDWPDNPHLLVMWADLVQLQDTEEGPTLEDAKAAYQRATELDPQAPEALMELGHYYFAIEDDAESAGKCYAKAITLCKQFLKEALLAQAKALAERERESDALACLAEAYWLQAQNGKTSGGGSRKEILEEMKDLVQ